MKRLVLGLGLVALAVITAACSGGSGGATASPAASAPAPSGAGGDEIVVVAKDLKFSTAAITAPADEPFQIVLDNQEAAPHNIAIKDGAGTTVFKGEVVTQTTVTNDVPALAAGAYEFWCEIHPDMKGTLTAG
jgi:plastocyanin